MARKKQGTRINNKTNKKAARKLDMAIIILLVASILLAVLIYTKSGIIGATLHDILGGIIGIVQYILPIGAIFLTLKLAIDGKEEMCIKLIQYVVMIISFSVLISIFQIISGDLNSSDTLSNIAKEAYTLGSNNVGGGAIGIVAAVPLTNLLRNCRSNNTMFRTSSYFSSIYVWN